jgi:uncharacterized Zn finger protein
VEGELAVSGSSLLMSEVVWEIQGLSPLRESHRVVRPGFLGRGATPADRCPNCGTIVVHPPIDQR